MSTSRIEAFQAALEKADSFNTSGLYHDSMKCLIHAVRMLGSELTAFPTLQTQGKAPDPAVIDVGQVRISLYRVAHRVDISSPVSPLVVEYWAHVTQTTGERIFSLVVDDDETKALEVLSLRFKLYASSLLPPLEDVLKVLGPTPWTSRIPS